MVGKRVVQLIDDLDGGPAYETVRFSLDGANYEIDLSLHNASKLRQNLAEYIGAARRTRPRRTSTLRPAAAVEALRGDRVQNRAIRAWAQRQGITLRKRGRIPNHVIAAYQRAEPAASNTLPAPLPRPRSALDHSAPVGHW
jgi:hypothetical protein